MSAQGSVLARVYTSDAYIPLQGIPVTFTQPLPEGGARLLALRLTNSSGLTEPLVLDTPEADQSLFPEGSDPPFARVDLATAAPGYNRLTVQGVQVFPGVETIQALQLHPISFGETGTAVEIPASRQNL